MTGSFGGSILGRHLDVQPRVAEALLLNQRYRLQAGIDCSDGLALDLWHVCEESRCGAVVDIERIPIAAAAKELSAQRNDGVSAVEHALSDGEDFELILAVPQKDAEQMLADQSLDGVTLTDIGEFVAERSLFQRGASGAKKPLEAKGYQHRFS